MKIGDLKASATIRLKDRTGAAWYGTRRGVPGLLVVVDVDGAPACSVIDFETKRAARDWLVAAGFEIVEVDA